MMTLEPGEIRLHCFACKQNQPHTLTAGWWVCACCLARTLQPLSSNPDIVHAEVDNAERHDG